MIQKQIFTSAGETDMKQKEELIMKTITRTRTSQTYPSITNAERLVFCSAAGAHLCLLAGAVLFLVWITVPKGKLFGSETDWFCQHVTIADTMRKQFLATGQLFPDWSSLGSGTNFYALSYYGFLRPDVLVSCFFPKVPMETFIQGYAILEMITGAWLFYWWLFQKEKTRSFCLMGGFLYVTSNCMFQAHRQLMFVSYLPFLILGLLCLDRMAQNGYGTFRKWFPVDPGFSLCIFLMILHSFYFFPACFVCCTLYFFSRNCRFSWKSLQVYLTSVAAGVSLSLFFLLPTALVILENKKDVKPVSLGQIFTVNPSLNTLLYSPYGCGLTLICLYCLLLALTSRKTRLLAASLCILLCSQLCCWLLNGTLYLRPKALIPFLPLILFVTVDILEKLHKGELSHRRIPLLLCLIPASVQVFFLHSRQKWLILTDAAVLFLYAGTGLVRKKHSKNILLFLQKASAFSLICLLPALLFVSTASTESYASVPASRTVFSEKDTESLCTSPGSAFDLLEAPMSNSNYSPGGMQRRTTMYSSISSSVYNHLFYDILKMPISARNRVSMNAGPNPFQEYLMGVRYIQTTRDRLPPGYQPILQNGASLLAENPHVLPAAYGTTALISEKEYDTLCFPYTLDTITNRTVVPSLNGAEKSTYTSQMKKYPLPADFMECRTGSQACTVTRRLPSPLENQILLLSFDVDYHGTKDVDVTINGIRNRLSGSSAPYPNRNTTFTYMLWDREALDIRFSRGNYKIQNVQAYTLPFSAIGHPDIVPFICASSDKKSLLQGSISMEQDGYFVTSFAWAKGYQILVDGRRTEPVMVNKGFVGFPIKKGAHEVTVSFHAPGKRIGILLSCAAALFLLLARLSTLPWSSALRFPPDSRNNSYGVRPL